MTKWRDRPHWRFAGRWLGSDEHGEWLGFPAGSPQDRPGRAQVSEVDSVTLVPGDAWHLATFHAPGGALEVYVDVATPARWDGSVLRSTDLDLDVVRLPDGTTYVDDEDELAEHRVSLGYPDDLVERAESACAEVLVAVRAGEPPYDGATAERWLAVLAGLDAPDRAG